MNSVGGNSRGGGSHRGGGGGGNGGSVGTGAGTMTTTTTNTGTNSAAGSIPGNIKISLRRRQTSLSQYQTTCISKHYALNNQILSAFESHYRNGLFLVAYHLGLKFAETALLEIPKHGYFYSDKHGRLRLQSSVDALRVTHLLHEIIAKEPKTLAEECHKVERLNHLAIEQYEHLDSYESERRMVEIELRRTYGRAGRNPSSSGQRSSLTDVARRSSANAYATLTSTLLACGDSFSSVFCPTPVSNPGVHATTSPPTGRLMIQDGDGGVAGEYKSAFPDESDVKASTGNRHFPPGSGGSTKAMTTTTAASSTTGSVTSNGSRSSSRNNNNDRYAVGPPGIERRQPSEDSADSTVYRPPLPPPPQQQHQRQRSTSSSSSLADGYVVVPHQSSTANGRNQRSNTNANIPPGARPPLPPGSMNNHSVPYTPAEEEKESSSSYVVLDQPTNFPPSNSTSALSSTADYRSMHVPGLPRPPSGQTPGAFGIPGPPLGLEKQTSQPDIDLQRALFVSGLQVALGPMVYDKDDDTGGVGGGDEKTVSSMDAQSIASASAMSATSSSIVPPSSMPYAPPGAKKRSSNVGVTMDMLTDCYHEDFDALRDTARIFVSQVPTYQGRIPDSTNGCTIIAPLLCIHHFHNEHQIPDPGLPDQIIVEVLDEETPNILPMIRKNLGLVKDAFLIPADAHEALMEEQYMCQEQFMTVCGGNILSDEHLDVLLDHLSVVGPKKLAATFFFHEHVITILQLRRSTKPTKRDTINNTINTPANSNVWFDIIDSLPHEETLLRVGETSPSMAAMATNNNNNNEEELVTKSMRLPSDGLISLDDDDMDMDMDMFENMAMVHDVPPQQCSRIRCLDVDSLKASLRWYACSVFTDENRTYIDTYQWDENLYDFDPRVFQAFLWTEA